MVILSFLWSVKEKSSLFDDIVSPAEFKSDVFEILKI